MRPRHVHDPRGDHVARGLPLKCLVSHPFARLNAEVCYHVYMTVPRAARVALAFAAFAVAVVAPAAADTFGGFSGVDRPYLVNQDKVCTPIAVIQGAASGMPACEKAGADVVAKLSIKNPLVQRGAKAAFGATAQGRTLTVTRTVNDQATTTVVTWTAPDPIGRVVDVYASQYHDRVAVAYTTRRLGRELTDVVAFDLGKPTAAAPRTDPPPPVPTAPPTAAPPEDPALTKAVAAARKAAKARRLQAWSKVLDLDASHAEAHYQIAAAHLAKKHKAEALASLGKLAASSRADAIEWLVEARYDKAFAALRADPRFRDQVGLDRKPGTTYERLMGFGGQWEQTGTSCDKPEVRLVATRDRVVRVRVKTKCGGRGSDLPFKGTWRLDGDRVILTFPTRGKQVSAEDQAPCQFETVGDEDALHCVLGRDIDFVVLPTRR